MRNEAAVRAELAELTDEFTQVSAMSWAGADPAVVAQARRDLGSRQDDLLVELREVRAAA